VQVRVVPLCRAVQDTITTILKIRAAAISSLLPPFSRLCLLQLEGAELGGDLLGALAQLRDELRPPFTEPSRIPGMVCVSVLFHAASILLREGTLLLSWVRIRSQVGPGRL
jgi:hypothetical protein